MESGRTGRNLRLGLALAGLIVCLAPPRAARAADEPWDAGRHWVTGRVGFVHSGSRFAPDGSFGYGFGYSWFLNRDLAFSASAGYDVLGKYGGAALIELPLTVDFTRHLHMSPAARPYLGVGWGGIYHKTYRTSADESRFRMGIYVATGANTIVSPSSLIGLDVRYMLEQDGRSVNPTFPNGEASATVFSVKLSYSRVF